MATAAALHAFPPARAAGVRRAAYRGVQMALATGFALRLVVAVWNGFFGPSYGAEADAAEFHRRAVAVLVGQDADSLTIAGIYARFLASVYAVTGESLFVGSVLSCAAWLAAGGLMVGIARELRLPRAPVLAAAWIFALLPTSVLHTGVTLREAYQLMFVNLAVLGAVRLLRRDTLGAWAMLAAGCAGMAVLHGALAGFAGLLAALLLLVRRHRSARRRSAFGTAVTVGVALALGGLAATQVFPALQAELLESLIASQQGYVNTEARAQYRTEFDVDGVLGIVAFVPQALGQYLFEPLPWRSLSAVDLGLVAENALRGLLMWWALRGFRRTPEAGRHGLFLVAMAWLLLEAIWAPGTVNWGTAARHHIPSLSLLLLAGFAGRHALAARRRRRPAACPAS